MSEPDVCDMQRVAGKIVQSAHGLLSLPHQHGAHTMQLSNQGVTNVVFGYLALQVAIPLACTQSRTRANKMDEKCGR